MRQTLDFLYRLDHASRRAAAPCQEQDRAQHHAVPPWTCQGAGSPRHRTILPSAPELGGTNLPVGGRYDFGPSLCIPVAQQGKGPQISRSSPFYFPPDSLSPK